MPGNTPCRCNGLTALLFTTLERFETFYLVVEGGGKTGFGEITPLPGYGGETVDEAAVAIARIASELTAGTARRGDHRPAGSPSYPFTASGLACAFETWGEGEARPSKPLSRAASPWRTPVPQIPRPR